MHVHMGAAHVLITTLEVLIALIAIKLVAANFTGRSSTADAVFGVL
jgi:hypothetical protein